MHLAIRALSKVNGIERCILLHVGYREPPNPAGLTGGMVWQSPYAKPRRLSFTVLFDPLIGTLGSLVRTQTNSNTRSYNKQAKGSETVERQISVFSQQSIEIP